MIPNKKETFYGYSPPGCQHYLSTALFKELERRNLSGGVYVWSKIEISLIIYYFP